MYNESKNIYLNVVDDFSKDCLLYIYIGGRGIGKTYSALKYIMENDIRFIYLRRSQKELDICASDAGNPFKKLNTDLHKAYTINGGDIPIVTEEDCNGEVKLKGYALALSTFSNVRGADFSDVEIIIYDEFIPQKTNRCFIRHEWDGLLNLIETVNRNREVEGEKSIKVVMLTNSTDIESDILAESGLIPVIEHMQRKGQEKYTDRSRGIFVRLCKAGISEFKRNTALYKLAGESEFTSHSLENEFSYDTAYDIKNNIKISEYIPIAMYENTTIWKHKSRCEYYVNRIRADVPKYRRENKGMFKRILYPQLKEAQLSNSLFYDSHMTKKTLADVL